MKVFTKIKGYLQWERELIAENQQSVRGSNKLLFSVLLCTGIFSVIVPLAASIFSRAYQEINGGYTIVLAIMILALFTLFQENYVNALVVYYFFYGLLVLYASYSSAYVTPDYVGVMILIYLFEMPVIILDRSLRIFLFEILTIIMYWAVVLPNKNETLVADEVVNVLVFGIISCVTGLFFRRTRLQSMDLSRRLDKQRTTDELTQLANRRMLFEYFGKVESGNDEGGRHDHGAVFAKSKNVSGTADANPEFPYALAIMDIDNFKQYNDTYGHVAGDKCLRQIGECFTAFGKENFADFYRYGGEEFVAIVHREPECDVTELFTGLNRKVEELKIPHSYLPGGFVTISIGVVKIVPEVGADGSRTVKFERRINDADIALYEAKGTGKGKTVEYEA